MKPLRQYHAIVAGDNYGQGSSREHAALAPRHLGLRVVIAKSFAHIHWQNLVNFGILPIVWDDESAYERTAQADVLRFTGVRAAIQNGKAVKGENQTQRFRFAAHHGLSPRQVSILRSGGLINHVKGRFAPQDPVAR